MLNIGSMKVNFKLIFWAIPIKNPVPLRLTLKLLPEDNSFSSSKELYVKTLNKDILHIVKFKI